MMLIVHFLAAWTLEASLAACLLVPLIRICQHTFGRHWPARWHAALWAFLVVRLALPLPLLGPEWVPSLRPHPTGAWTQTPVTAPLEQRVPPPVLDHPAFKGNALLTLELYWFIGVMLVLAAAAFQHLRLKRRLRRAGVVTSGPAWSRLEALRHQLSLPRPVLLLESDDIATPALVGRRHPRIVLPLGMADTADAATLEHVLAHELMHLKRRDMGLGLVMLALQALHWFNPLVWYAFHRLRQDRELACDEAVVTTFGTDIQAYGETLLAFTHTRPDHRCLPGSLGLGTHVPLIRRRIQALAGLMEGRIPRTWPRVALLLLVFVAGLSTLGVFPRVPFQGMAPIPLGPFTDDPALHGRWSSVDFVARPGDFKPDHRAWKSSLYLSDLEVQPGGRAKATLEEQHRWTWQWTQGAFRYSDSVPAPYEIRQVQGRDYLFLSWMSGDVTHWGQTPHFYVLERKS